MMAYKSRQMLLRQILASLLLLNLFISTAHASEEDVVVFAAASTSEAVSALGSVFEKRTGFPVIASFAGSGTLARQIKEGAPADIFISANLSWMDYLEQAALIEKGSLITIASNNLILVAPNEAMLPDPFKFENFPAILGSGRLAIGNPAHVPAGTYAKAALESLGLWKKIEGNLVMLPNVRAVLALVERGEAPFAIIYETDMRLARNIQLAAIFPRSSHPAISYAMAKIKGNDGHSTDLFYKFVRSAEGQEILRRHGFLVLEN
ncbi:molybdate ABC transporter substrate-binding protein [Sneathiella sp. HT1-7]|uniref:molybdate ABC transporter substrate-binding protein n=1 Tax=Sneathiella sp. HT1-7 TaxID=2887192 RepID=UPI001D135F0B|nr:molybdate ABC transporter substrate-binding protein [Sneathiella sp. HT1-7]MCC3306706.1 molybdate ABC transporter substrate-binding protein [Sneathiella sp. HT1-7]